MMAGAPKAARIILVRHARPVMDRKQPASRWPLDPSGTETVARLAGILRTTGADGVVASPEQKALETGRIIASELRLPLSIEPDLREQGGEQVPWMDSGEDFRAAVAGHFPRPAQVVLGAETSCDAVDRFEMVVNRARLNHRFPVLVTHGRILCGYMARVLDLDPMSIWPRLLMPDAFAIDLDARRWQRVDEEDPL